MEDYTYTTPPGYGDTFYVYAYDSTTIPLVSGSTYNNLRILINDGDFIARWWRGCDLYANISQGIQIRDYLQNPYWSANLQPFLQPSNQQSLLASTGWAILPEKWYPDSGYIGFDLISALPNITPNVSGIGQLAFYGVRRRKGLLNDPQVYTYPSYEKVFDLQTTVTLPTGFSSASGGYLTALEVPDYDFECRRVDGFGGSTGIAATLSLTPAD